MKNRFRKYMVLLPLVFGSACTDLSETLYSQVGDSNLIQTRKDILAITLRPFDHAFWSIGSLPRLQENSADQWCTYTRCGDLWYEGGLFVRFHRHEWTLDDSDINGAWDAAWMGIAQCNNALDLVEGLDPNKYGMAREEHEALIGSCKTLRAWFYIHLFDLYRNLPVYVSQIHTNRNTETQVSPAAMFDFIEGELLAQLNNSYMPVKSGLGGNQTSQGQWNKAGVASLLVRLYLNSEKWTGTARYTECADLAKRIIDGEWGPYKLGETWDSAFDWDNDKSDEVIFGFPSNIEHAHTHYGMNVYYWGLCGDVNSKYFLSSVDGDPNFQFALTPGLDNNGDELNHKLGKPVRKFMNYPGDYRLSLYKNLDNGRREGMFLRGRIPNLKEGTGKHLIQGYGLSAQSELCIRDQAGFFYDTPEHQLSIDDKRSGVQYADMNSGWRLVKYPFYGDAFAAQIYNADYAEIRLAEIHYSLAECKLRAGDASGAADLLNQVRKRNYPSADWDNSLYRGTQSPQGTVTLDMNEMLDEWGREFIGELRRRTDLVRFNRFGEAWWDKPANNNPDLEIFPISRTALSANPKLNQNPGYNN